MIELEQMFQNMGFSDAQAVDISKCFELVSFNKGDFFLESENMYNSLGFIASGIFQFFYYKDGDEITTYIAFKNDFILSIQSFFANKPAKESIRALVDSQVFIIEKSEFENLKDKIPGFKDFYISVLEGILVCIDESRFDYITLSPEERYMKLLEEEPILLQEIPLKYLSALIGVTPRHLSRIRNNIR